MFQGPVLRRAAASSLDAETPCLIEAVVDPREPIFPPSFDAKEAANLAKALIRGATGRAGIARTIAADVVREII